MRCKYHSERLKRVQQLMESNRRKIQGQQQIVFETSLSPEQLHSLARPRFLKRWNNCSVVPSYNAINTHIAEYYQRHEKDKEGSKENVRDFLHSFILIRSSAIQTFKGPTVYDWQRENENQGFDKRDNPYYKNGQNGVLFGEIYWVFLWLSYAVISIN